MAGATDGCCCFTGKMHLNLQKKSDCPSWIKRSNPPQVNKKRAVQNREQPLKRYLVILSIFNLQESSLSHLDNNWGIQK